jgi:Flp pilus assembly CpaF family ATPase
MQDHHSDEKQERLKEKLRDELGPVICGLLDKTNTGQSSGIEDILVNEDCRIWVKRTGSAFEHIGELDSRQSRGAMMTIASMQKTTVTESKPVLESQLPIWKYRFAGLIEPVVVSPSFAIRVKSDKKRSLRDLQRQGILTTKDDPRNRRSESRKTSSTRSAASIILRSFSRPSPRIRTSWLSAGPARARRQSPTPFSKRSGR